MPAWIMKTDHDVLKPFFIFEYSDAKQQEVDEFDETFIRKRREQEDKIKDLLGDTLAK